MIGYWAMRAGQATLRTLPMRLAERLAVPIASLIYYALPRKRANMQRNLHVVLGTKPLDPRADRRVRDLARRSMIAYAITLLDFLRMPRLLARVYRDSERSPGWEHLDRAVDAGRGAIFVTAHFGHWDLAGAAVAHHLPPGAIYAVAESFPDPRIDSMVTAERAAYGLQTVPMDNVRQMLRVLREGKVLGILADRPLSNDSGVPVTFFGRPAQIPAGAATLAALARCPIIPGYLFRRSDGRFDGAILPAIEPVRTGDRDGDLRATTQQVAAALETIIRRAPHQWFMFRDMWPTEAAPGRARFAPSRLLATTVLSFRRRD